MSATLNVLKYFFKWLAAIIIIILTVLFTIQVVVIVHFDKIIEDSLKETIRKATGDLYSLEFENLSINVFTGSLSAVQLHLKPDTLIYKRLKEMRQAPTVLLDVIIPELRINRVDVYNIYINKKLNINKIFLRNPSVILLNEPENKKTRGRRLKDPLDFYPLISSIFKKATVNRIEIQNAALSFTRTKRKGKGSFKHNLPNISLDFNKVTIDSTAHVDTTNFFYSEDINISLNDYQVKLPDSLYVCEVGHVNLSSKLSYAKLENIKLIPRYGKYKFARVHGHQVDRLSMNIKKVEFKELNFRRLLDDQAVLLDELLVNDFNISAFRDKRIIRDATKRPQMPVDALKSLDFYVKINKIRLRNLNVEYEEVPEKGGPAGRVSFDQIYARITDITNDSDLISKGKIMWLKAQGNLMEKGRINAVFKFPLNDPSGTYYYQGTLGSMNLNLMNPMIRPLTNIEIHDGKIQKIEFDVTANNDMAFGRMKFLYNNLNIKLINKETGEVGIKEKLGSFIANNFIVISDNPKNGELRPGKMYFERDKSKFIFNYWWKTILSGVKPSIGFDEEKQTKVKHIKDKWQERLRKRKQKKLDRMERKLAKRNKEEKELSQ